MSKSKKNNNAWIIGGIIAGAATLILGEKYGKEIRKFISGDPPGGPTNPDPGTRRP